MTGRFTGMRQVHVKQDMVTRTTKLVSAGIIPKEPTWLTVMKRLPPQVPGPRTGKPPKIVLPTDRLYKIRDARFKEGRNMPYFAHGEMQSQAMVFAQRQWALMRNEKLSERDAYAAVERLEGEAKERALAQVQYLTASLKSAAAATSSSREDEEEEEAAVVPSLLRPVSEEVIGEVIHKSASTSPFSIKGGGLMAGMSSTMEGESLEAREALAKAMGLTDKQNKTGSGSSVMEQLSAWKQKLADYPYREWSLGQQVMLDHWVCKVCLSWGWEQERYLHDAKFEQELAQLRAALFPELGRSGVGTNGDEDDEDDEDDLDLTMEEMAARRAAEEASEAHQKELEALVKTVDWNDPVLSDQVNEWYVSFGKWQTKVFEHEHSDDGGGGGGGGGGFAAWPKEDQDGLDEWVLRSCLPTSAVQGLSDEGAVQALALARYQLFPRLDPANKDKNASSGGSEEGGDRVALRKQQGRYDVVPELKDVRRILAVKQQEQQQEGGAPSPAAAAAAGGGGSNNMAYTRSLGLEAIRMLEKKGLDMETSSSSSFLAKSADAPPPRPGLFAGLADDRLRRHGMEDEDDEDEDEDDDLDYLNDDYVEPEDEDDEEDQEGVEVSAATKARRQAKAENRALEKDIKARWDEEQAVIKQAWRDDWWKKREYAREELISEASLDNDEKDRANALAFALPGLGKDSSNDDDNNDEDDHHEGARGRGKRKNKGNRGQEFTK